MRQDLLTKNKKGYTLTEVLIALVFLGIIIVSLALPFSESINLSVDDQNIIKANNLARLYLKDTELSWQLQTDFDEGFLPEIVSKYTDNDNYTVSVEDQDIQTNSSGNVIIRRVTINYKTSSGTETVNLFLDFNRPGSTLN